MKILQVIPYFFPAYSFGGPVKVAHQLSRELVKRGHEVVVYTSDARDLDSRLEISVDSNIGGIRANYFKNLFWFFVKKFKLFITPQLFLHARREVKTFDVIHLHEYRSFQNVVIAYYAKKYGVPYIVHAHGSLPRIMAKQNLKQIFDVLFGYSLLRNATKVIALSSVEAEQYTRMGVPKEKIVIMPNGIDLSDYGNLPPKGMFKKKFSIPSKQKIILYLGRIHRTKGLDFLIKAYAHLVNDLKLNDTLLVITGPDDGYLDELRALADSLNISSSILVTGFISNDDKLNALIDADVFVTASFHGFPVTFLEACVAGTPIVTTTLGDELPWMHDNVGYVTQPTCHALANAISIILSDGCLAELFSRSCRKTVQSMFCLEKIATNLEKLYNEIVVERNS